MRQAIITILSLFCAFLSPVITIAQSGLDALSASTEVEMKKHNLNGLSIAVFKDYRIVWVKEWGIKAAGSDEQIKVNTAYSTASISKPITALLCAILEEKGLINLDAPIENDLKRWHLPENPYSKEIKVTWKQLLSHTAGTNQSGFADYYEGDKMPTIVQSLNGELLERQDGGIKFLFKPGTNWEYSGGGYVIIQLALEDHFGQSLASLAETYLFQPLHLLNTTMVQPGEKGFPTNVAKAHDRAGKIIRTGLPVTPQVAPSGMWSTPTDLAIIALAMQNALRGKGNNVISTAVAKKLTDIITYQGISGYGMGWQRSLGFGNQDWFSHMGSNTGIGGEIMGAMEHGNGIVMLANGDVPSRLPVFNYLRNHVFQIYHWNLPVNPASVKIVPPYIIKAISGSYLDFLYGDRGINKIFPENGKLFLNTPLFKLLLNQVKTPLYYMGNNTFKIANYPNYLQFNLSKDQKLNEIVIYRYPSDPHKLRIPLSEIRNLKTELIDLFTGNDFNTAKHGYQKLKKEHPAFDFENTLNGIGAVFYYEDQIKLCIQLLEFNREENPNSWNVYDSLGEIYEVSQQFQNAIKNYQRAAELNISASYKEQINAKILSLKSKIINGH